MVISEFNTFGLNSQINRAIDGAGYTKPTPIQSQTIPKILSGRDIIGVAQTGTGKTAAFALPILQLLSSKKTSSKKHIRVLVLSPTRELAIQIDDSFSEYSQYIKELSNTVIFGGVKAHSQIQALQKGVDILVATPGRLLDLIGQGYISLKQIELLVFDEADRMLDMGFIHDVRRIMKTVPHKSERQTLLFSATMPKSIVQLAKNILNHPLRVSITPEQPTVEIIDQTVYFVSKNQKQNLLNTLLVDPKVVRCLVFSRTKHGANKIVKKLGQVGVSALPIHGNKSQNARQLALKNFRDGKTRILVATDVAARGIDVTNITHVIQFDLPNVPETYVHRIGRTGRAGAGGIAISFCDEPERPLLKDIQKLIKMKIPITKTTITNVPKMIRPSTPQRQTKPSSRPRQHKKPVKSFSKSKPARPVNSKVKPSPQSEKNIPCPHCTRKFGTQRALSQHVSAGHNK